MLKIILNFTPRSAVSNLQRSSFLVGWDMGLNKGQFGHALTDPVVRRRQRILFAAVGVLTFILLTAIGVVVSSKDKRSAASSPDSMGALASNLGTIALYTPGELIRPGVKMSEAKFKEEYWPRNKVPEGAVTNLDEVKHMYSRIEIPAGTPVQMIHLMEAKGTFDLPLTPGNRAVTIEVDDITGLEGHAGPGTRVDVVLTHHVEGRLTSQVIVQNARVISYGGSTKTAEEKKFMLTTQGGARTSARTMTLDVPAEEALKVTTARQLGRLSLMMRAPEDTGAAPSTEVDETSISDDSQISKSTGPGGKCNRGTMRIGGEEFVVGCEGDINQAPPKGKQKK